jgi:hypothetical protein
MEEVKGRYVHVHRITVCSRSTRSFLIRKDSVITDVSQIQVILQNEIYLHYAILTIVNSQIAYRKHQAR